MKKKASLLSIPVILLLAGCNLAGLAPSSAPVTTQAGFNPPAAATASLPPPPTETVTPAPLPTSTLVLPVAIGTPLPQPGAVISPDNAKTIVEIADVGGQSNPIWMAAFTTDGRILAAAGSENDVKLWDATGTGDPSHL